jgi:hypothetical protein
LNSAYFYLELEGKMLFALITKGLSAEVESQPLKFVNNEDDKNFPSRKAAPVSDTIESIERDMHRGY